MSSEMPEDAAQIARIARLEEKIIALELSSAKTEAYLRGALDSFNHDLVANHDDMSSRFAALDALVRGNGSAGLVTKITMLESLASRTGRLAWILIGAVVMIVGKMLFDGLIYLPIK